MLKQRLITAAVCLPLYILCLAFAPSYFIYALFMLCSGACVYEVSRMLFPAIKGRFGVEMAEEGSSSFEPKLCVLISFVLYVMTSSEYFGNHSSALVSVVFLAILVSVFSGKSIDHSLANACASVLSLCYGCFPWLVIWDLYHMGDQAKYIFLISAIIMMGDSGAYFAGMYFGKTKLAPRYSPKKTWEGVFGGLLASAIGALVINLVFAGSIGPTWFVIVLAVFVGAAGVLGDLVESSFKRFSAVKDSGSLFPGHGGILDRFDSWLFAAPLMWLFLKTYHFFNA